MMTNDGSRREGNIFGVIWSLTERWTANGADGRWAIVQIDSDGNIMLICGRHTEMDVSHERDVMSAMERGARWCREGI